MKDFTASNGVTIGRYARSLDVQDDDRTVGSWLEPRKVEALREFFRAERDEPKPWHDANPWETWALTIDGQEYSRTLDEDREFRDPDYLTEDAWIHITDPRITAGRRLWPEDS